MKRPFLKLTKLSEKQFLGIWLVYHLFIIVAFCILCLARNGVVIDADLMNMFPKSFEEESVRKADEQLTDSTGQNVFILVENEDFYKAKNSAEKVYNSILKSENFLTVSFYNDMNSISEVTDFIFKYRWNMLDDKSIELINSEGGAEIFANNALGKVFGAFTMTSLDNLDRDPFMLSENNLNNYLNAVQTSGTAMTIKDGVLASQKDGKWYVMIRGILSKKGAALASEDNGVNEIYKACEQAKTDGTDFVFSGTPFHSNESSNSAMREISIISTVSLLIVVIMLFIVFKSPKPIIFSVGSIGISILTAIMATLAVFQKMHILTLVFGTSLIGSCIDYSLHYFVHWAGNPELKSGIEIRNHLMKGLLMAILSSGICFAILLFAPFNMLRQMALFSLSGLISSFLTTLAIYPFIPLPKNERNLKLSKIMARSEKYNSKLVGRIAITSLFVLTIGSLLIFHDNVKLKNDVSSLYTMEGELLEQETKANEIIQYSPTGWFIVRGKTESEALLNEEILTQKLQNDERTKSGYISTTLFIPSIEKQKKSREACKKLLELAESQYELLGYDSSYAKNLRKEFEDSENDFISFENQNIPEFIMNSIKTAWLGEIDGQYYTVIMPSVINDENACRSYTDDKNIFFINKLSDMSSDLDRLSQIILIFFLIACIVIFVLLKFTYKLKQSMKIISIPFLIVGVTTAIFAISKTNLEFFSITGLILVFGLGLDYIIYMIENEKPEHKSTNTLEPFATMLSFATTVISFGALALSSFKPIHLIGLSITIGLTTAYVSTIFYDRSR